MTERENNTAAQGHAIGCEKCKPFGGEGYRLDTNTDREHPYPRIVVCDCAQTQCRCGAFSGESRSAGPAFDKLPERAAEAVDERTCPCYIPRQKVARINRLLATARVDAPGIVLSNMQTTVGNRTFEEIQRAVGLASTFAETAAKGEQQKGIYLYGTTGSGKTYLANALLNELIIRTRQPGLFVNVTQQLFPRLRATYDGEGRSETELQVMSQLARMPHLVLDDLGVERNTKWEAEVLYNIIDARYRKRKPVIVTSNLGPDDPEMKSLSRGRVTSRLAHMCRVMKMPDEDLRPYFEYAVR